MAPAGPEELGLPEQTQSRPSAGPAHRRVDRAPGVTAWERQGGKLVRTEPHDLHPAPPPSEGTGGGLPGLHALHLLRTTGQGGSGPAWPFSCPLQTSGLLDHTQILTSGHWESSLLLNPPPPSSLRLGERGWGGRGGRQQSQLPGRVPCHSDKVVCKYAIQSPHMIMRPP